MHLSMLLEDEIVCLVSRRHPSPARALTTDDYQRAAVIVPMPYSISQRGVIDTVLAWPAASAATRQVVVQSPSAPRPTCSTTPTWCSPPPATSRATTPICCPWRFPLADPFPPMRFYQLWHERNHQSAAHRWIRRLMTAARRSRCRLPAVVDRLAIGSLFGLIAGRATARKGTQMDFPRRPRHAAGPVADLPRLRADGDVLQREHRRWR